MRSGPACLLAALCTTTSVARADETFRCPTGRLISVGTLLPDAREKCGPPTRNNRRTEKQRVRERALDPIDGTPIWIERDLEIQVEEWLFDQGNARFVRVLRFENGTLASISTGPYGGSR